MHSVHLHTQLLIRNSNNPLPITVKLRTKEKFGTALTCYMDVIVITDCMKLKESDTGVAYGGINFIPNFLITGELVQILKRRKHR